jgi:hypothetical protein
MQIYKKLTQGSESRTHYAAKDRAAEICRSSNRLVLNTFEVGRWTTYRMDLTGCEIVTECAYPSGESVENKSYYVAKHGRLPPMIFDVGVVKNGKVVAAVELALSHWIDAKKWAKIAVSPVIVIEAHAFHPQWIMDGNNKIECENLRVPLRPLVELRRILPGDYA